jgi:hypothetical protein
MAKQRLGIIQSRGLGDLIIALPIAKHSADQGHEIYWPVCTEFVSHMQSVAPWVKWIPVPTDAQGKFFYDEPMARLKNFKCEDIVCLYQSLTGHPEFAAVPYFQIQKFDEYKYTVASVPFYKKWTLSECISRNELREQTLYDKLVKNPNYAVVHAKGSSYTCQPDLSAIPKDWQIIHIDEATDSVFDWLKIIEGAQAGIFIDSIFSNLVDQLDIDIDKYWIPRSHIQLTPVLGSTWTILDVPPDSQAATRIFS